jgi:histidine ammonia-lyase
MGWGAGRKLLEVVANVRRILAVELLCAAQAIEYRAPLEPAPGTAAIVARIRDVVPPLQGDRSPAREIEQIAELIESGELA